MKRSEKQKHTKMVEIRREPNKNETDTQLEELRQAIRIQKLLGDPLVLEIDDDNPLLDDMNSDITHGCFKHLLSRIKKLFS